MKERIDVLLVDRGLVPSREKAQAFLMAGAVSVNGRLETKAGTRYETGAEILLAADPVPYVSRGGLKLEGALDAWDITLSGCVCIDIGASTGGFTDLMLQRGAIKVYAIDVGYGQLDYKLRIDPRVVNIERTNVRLLDPAGFPEKADFISVDVSFISLKLVLPVAKGLLKGGACLVALVKPQFEAERAQVGKGGIVRDDAVRGEVLQKVRGYAAAAGFAPDAVMESPIKGTKGNVEYLMLMRPEP
ncbi:MAG: TlyA family RNA methyltransferase [Clostridiales Family XIII bacterium]|nr:TlyA family RNA methyltransferase [Clostridiales Family XIII bacterium]